MSDDLGANIEAVARFYWQEPNKSLSNQKTLRWGAGGSKKADLEKGTWYDFEAQVGGGVLDLVRVEGRLEGADAIAFLRETIGAEIEERQAFKPAPQPKAKAPKPKGQIVATYDYTDENGGLLFQVCRFEPKTFLQRRKPREDDAPEDIRGGWVWKAADSERVLYRLPEVIEAVSMERTVLIAEGEKDCDNLWALGIPATTNPGGAGKWTEEIQEPLEGADVVVLADNDPQAKNPKGELLFHEDGRPKHPGQDHALHVVDCLKGFARSVKYLELPNLPPKGDVSDWLAQGHQPDELYALASKATDGPAFRSRFGAVTWGDLDAQATARDFLVDDMLFCGDSSLMYGPSMSGKSFLATDLGLSIALGRPFLGKKTRKGAVIYQAGEGGRGLISRLKAYRLAHGIEKDDDVPFVLLTSKVDLFAPNGDVDRLIEEIKAWAPQLSEPLSLVVIDTFSTASPGANENASEDMSRVLSNVARIQTECQCATLVVHHMNAKAEKPRGHTSLFANVDSAFEILRNEDDPSRRTLKTAKVKDSEDGVIIPFRLQQITLGFRPEDEKPITSCIVAHDQGGDDRLDPDKPLRYPLTGGQAVFLRVLKRAIEASGDYAPATIQAEDQYTKIVEWPIFKALYDRSGNPDRTPDATSKALQRDGDALMKKGLIGRDKPYIWLTREGLRHA